MLITHWCKLILTVLIINTWLTQHIFSVWPVAQPVVGEMEMHSVANLATLQTTVATFSLQKSAQTLFSFWEFMGLPREHEVLLSQCAPLSLSLSLCASALFSERRRRAAHSVKHRYYVACFSNFTSKYSRNHSTAIFIILCVFDLIRREFLCRLTSWKGELVM